MVSAPARPWPQLQVSVQFPAVTARGLDAQHAAAGLAQMLHYLCDGLLQASCK